MTADQTLIYDYIVGDKMSTSVQQQAIFLKMYNAEIKFDNAIPLPTASTYYALFYHRAAITMATAIEPNPDPMGGLIKETFVYPKGPQLPIKIQMFGDGINQGTVVNVSCVYGKAVTRPEYGVCITSA